MVCLHAMCLIPCPFFKFCSHWFSAAVCPHVQNQWRIKSHGFFGILLLGLMFNCRVGEASKSGPTFIQVFVLVAYERQGALHSFTACPWGHMGGCRDALVRSVRPSIQGRFAFCPEPVLILCRTSSPCCWLTFSPRCMERNGGFVQTSHKNFANVWASGNVSILSCHGHFSPG